MQCSRYLSALHVPLHCTAALVMRATPTDRADSSGAVQCSRYLSALHVPLHCTALHCSASDESYTDRQSRQLTKYTTSYRQDAGYSKRLLFFAQNVILMKQNVALYSITLHTSQRGSSRCHQINPVPVLQPPIYHTQYAQRLFH